MIFHYFSPLFPVDFPLLHSLVIDSSAEAQESAIEAAVKHSDTVLLHRLLFDHSEKIGRVLAISSQTSAGDSHVYEDLVTQLAQLGDPPRIDVLVRIYIYIYGVGICA